MYRTFATNTNDMAEFAMVSSTAITHRMIRCYKKYSTTTL